METRVKERLTGALILVAALVILVPEIFSGRRVGEAPRETPAAPATEGPPLRTYTAELNAGQPSAPEQPVEESPAQPPPEAAPPPESVPEPQPSTSSSTSIEAPAPRESSPAPEAPSAVQPAQPPAPTPQPPAASGGWYVQVGSFGQAANAQRIAGQLREKGFSVHVLPPASGQKLTRVRVGPARDREAALELQRRLAAAGQKGGALVAP